MTTNNNTNNNKFRITEGVVLKNGHCLAVGRKVWQSLIQLSKGKNFFEKYDLYCAGFVREENCKDMLKDGWYIGAIAAQALQFNSNRVALSGRWGKRAAVLVNFKDRSVRIVTRQPIEAQTKYIEEFGSKMKRIPLIVESAEALKARIYS